VDTGALLQHQLNRWTGRQIERQTDRRLPIAMLRSVERIVLKMYHQLQTWEVDQVVVYIMIVNIRPLLGIIRPLVGRTPKYTFTQADSAQFLSVTSRRIRRQRINIVVRHNYCFIEQYRLISNANTSYDAVCFPLCRNWVNRK